MQKNKRGAPRAFFPKQKPKSRKMVYNKSSKLLYSSIPSSPFSDERISPPLRILMVIDQFNVGGTETYTLSLTRELLRKGHIVVVAGKKGEILDSFIGIGCPVYEIDFVTEHYQPDPDNHTKHFKLLKDIIETERIDIIHGHQMASGTVAKLAANKMNIPFVFTVHGAYYDLKFLQMLQRDSTMVAVSPAIERLLRANRIRSVLIPNGLDVIEYDDYTPPYREYLRHKMGIPQMAKVVMYASRLSWKKATICKEIIPALSEMLLHEYPDIHLIIVGGGRDQDHIVKLAASEQQRIDSPFIHYPGEVLNMRGYYSISDCIIGTGRVGLEAMASKRPLISVGSKGFLGLVQPDNYEKAWDGWFGDHDSNLKLTRDILMEHIRSVLNMEEQNKSLLIESGRKFVTDRFHISIITEELLHVYRSKISAKKEAFVFHQK